MLFFLRADWREKRDRVQRSILGQSGNLPLVGACRTIESIAGALWYRRMRRFRDRRASGRSLPPCVEGRLCFWRFDGTGIHRMRHKEWQGFAALTKSDRIVLRHSRSGKPPDRATHRSAATSDRSQQATDHSKRSRYATRAKI